MNATTCGVSNDSAAVSELASTSYTSIMNSATDLAHKLRRHVRGQRGDGRTNARIKAVCGRCAGA